MPDFSACNIALRKSLIMGSQSQLLAMKSMNMFSKEEWSNESHSFTGTGLFPDAIIDMDYDDAKEIASKINEIQEVSSLQISNTSIYSTYISNNQLQAYSACLNASAQEVFRAWLPDGISESVNQDTRDTFAINVSWRPQGQVLKHIKITSKNCQLVGSDEIRPTDNTENTIVFLREDKKNSVVVFEAILENNQPFKTVAIECTYIPKLTVVPKTDVVMVEVTLGGGPNPNHVGRPFTVTASYPYFIPKQPITHTWRSLDGGQPTGVTAGAGILTASKVQGEAALSWPVGGTQGNIVVSIPITVGKFETFLDGQPIGGNGTGGIIIGEDVAHKLKF